MNLSMCFNLCTVVTNFGTRLSQMYNPLLLFGKLSISISAVNNVSDASFPLVARAKYIDTALRMLWFVSIVEFVETGATLTNTT